MKKWAILCGIALAMGCTSRTMNPGYKIIGNIYGLGNSKVLLYKYINETWSVVDSAESKNGSFMFFGRVEAPEMYKVEISDTLPAISIFIENDEINLVAKVDDLRNYKVAGSKSHEEYERFWGKQNIYSMKMDSLEKELSIAKREHNRKKAAIIVAQKESLWNAEIESIRYHVLENNSSVVSAYLAWSRLASNSNVQQLEKITKSIDISLNKTLYVKLLKNYIDKLKRVETGKPAIDFTMNNQQGTPLKLSSLYGKYLLIDFWASWCPPCRADNPKTVDVFNKFKDMGFDILGVSFDKDSANWLKAVNDDKLAWNHVSDLNGWGNAAGKMYGVRSIPSNILLDPNGVIVGKNLKGEELENKLKEIFDYVN